jgi:alpha-L-rhamnosidase
VQKISEPRPGVYVLDFGQNFTGHVRLRLRAPEGTAVTMRYAEKVKADGSLDQSNIDYYMTKTSPRQLFQEDTYICKGGGEEVWEQRFSYSGFRYAEVTGLPFRPEPGDFTGRFAHTALESAGEFSCSDTMINKIQSATLWSYLSNAQSIPTDCPQREKNGWTADAHLAAEAGLMNFRAVSFYTKWLDDFADNQLEDGRLGDIIPSGGWGMGGCHPAWDSAYAIIAWDLYRYCGDTRILDRHYGHIARYVDYIAGRTEDGVISFDSLGDWVPWKTETPSKLTSTIFLYHDARILADAARILGRTDDESKYAALADKTLQAFNAKWFDAERGVYADGEQTAQAMPLFFGMVPEGREDGVFAALTGDLERQGHIDSGILGAKYIIRVLAQRGRSDLAFAIVTRREQPSWAWWIEQGATTLWEDWKGAESLNHIMFGDVSNWFYQWIAGIGLDPDVPGFGHILIQPQPVGGLTWAKARHESPHGPIVSEWKQENGIFHLSVSIPANATATIRVPASGRARVLEGGRPAKESKGLRLLSREPGHAVYAGGSGDYAFTVQD